MQKFMVFQLPQSQNEKEIYLQTVNAECEEKAVKMVRHQADPNVELIAMTEQEYADSVDWN